ncbi:MAG: YDG domain-containing protein, partial [Pseudomonas sp.]
NYELSNATSSTTATIERKTLTVAEASAQDKTYDGSTTANVTAGLLSGLVGEETLTASATGTFSDKNAGENKTVSTTTTFADGSNGGLASNYELSNANGSTSATITAKSLEISELSAQDKTFDGTTSATLNLNDAALTGVVGADSVSISAGTGAFENAAVGNDKTVNVTGLQLGGDDARNYQLASTRTSTTASILSAPTQAPDNTSIQGVISQATQVLALQGSGRTLQAQQVGGGMVTLITPEFSPTSATLTGGLSLIHTTREDTQNGSPTVTAPSTSGVDAAGFVQVTVLEGGINLINPNATQNESE